MTMNLVLSRYGMFGYEKKEITPNVTKIFVGDKSVAVKKAKRKDLINRFRMTYQLARYYRLSMIVPLYISKQNELAVQSGGEWYYVMPWIESSANPSASYYTRLFSELASIHTRTAHVSSCNPEYYKEWADRQQKETEQHFLRYEKKIGQVENRHYMSPCEYQLCYLYPLFHDVCRRAGRWYNRWQDYLSEEKQMRTVLCHGSLRPSHVLQGKNGLMFINWESAHMGHPGTDLGSLIRNALSSPRPPFDTIEKGLRDYRNKTSLERNELAWMMLYLMRTDLFLSHVDQYLNRQQSAPEVKWAQRFERFRFYFSNLLSLEEKVNQMLQEYSDDQIQSK